MNALFETRNFEDGTSPMLIGHNVVGPKNSNHNIVSCRPNWHEDMEIIYCVGGETQVGCRDALYQMKKGDIMVINSNEIHWIELPKESFEYYYLIISCKFGADNGIEMDLCLFEPMVQDKTCQNKIEAVVKAYKSKEAFHVASLRIATLSLLVYLAKNHLINRKIFEVDATENSSKIAMAAIAYIKKNFTKKITLEDIAREVCVSRYYLSHVFKEYTGRSIVAYINYLRCDYAHSLMMLGQYSVSEVCTMCGFGTVSYFDKVFKKVWGKLPSEIRNIARSSIEEIPDPVKQ